MAALPFPGRWEGIRFTTTEDDLGMTWESSLYSEERMSQNPNNDAAEVNVPWLVDAS